MGTIRVPAAIIAIVGFLGGIALTFTASGVLTGGGPDALTVLMHGYLALGGVGIAVVAAVLGRGYRCINCNSWQ